MSLIQCKLGPTTQAVAGRSYSFELDRDGRAVADVDNPDHQACFLAIEHYVRVAPLAPRTPPAVGLGSSEEDGEDLRINGPTIEEWVKGGYLASAYPPKGYASRSTPEEVAAAIAVEREAAKEGNDAGDGSEGGFGAGDETASADPNQPLQAPTGMGIDIIVIKGVGDALKAKLSSYGVNTVEDLLKLDAAGLELLDKDLKLHGAIERDKWIEQAKAMVAQDPASTAE